MTERKVAGRYRLLEPIGEGGMGVVWRSHDELLDRVVAVKEVRYRGVDEAARADLNRRTIREAKTAGRLDHPSVIIVHDVVEEEGRPWIVMQLVRSRSLGEVVREGGPLPPARVAEVGLHVLSALRAAHAAGVLHRDVKPENVLLADDGRVVLTDFGIASMTQETGITRTGGMVGTPAFLPPERLHGMTATPESDLWSLGATLYAALEGRPPFERPTAAATMMAVLNGEPSPMAHAGPLTAAILGLMAREPAARMSADEAEALLTRAAAETRSEDRSPRAGTAGRHSRPPHGAPQGAGQPPLPQDQSFSQHPTGPASPGRSFHPTAPSDRPFDADPLGSGQPPYANDPARSPYRDGSTQAGQPPYPNDPFQALNSGGPGQAGQWPYPQDPFQAPYPGTPPQAGQPQAGQPPYLHTPHATPAQPPYPNDPFQAPYPNAAPQTGQPSYGFEPAYQGPRTQRGQHAATDEPAPRDRRPGARRIALMVGIPVLVLVVGVGGWLAFTNLTGDPGNTQKPPTATAALPDPTGSPTRPPKSPDPTGSVTKPSKSPRPTRLPEGWQSYRDPVMGFSVAMPRGWVSKRFSGRDRVEFRAPGSDALLWIESTEDPETDPVRHWEKVEKGGLAKNIWPGYERVGITPLRYRGVEAADWEFTYLKNNVPTHVLDRGFRTITGRPYAIYWESPESEWDRTFFDRFIETFRP